MVIGIRQDRLTIISPFKDTPAYEAGVQSGDIISLIEEEPTATMTVDEAVERLRGEPGTQVTITLLREGETEPLEVTITRDVIRFRSVESKVLTAMSGTSESISSVTRQAPTWTKPSNPSVCRNFAGWFGFAV